MKVIRGLHNIKKQPEGCVVTIGNFDGIHIGHQQLIVKLQQIMAQKKLPGIVITMEPHPQEYFAGNSAPARLTRFREKIHIFQQLGVQQLLCLRFNTELAQLSAKDFIRIVLVENLGAKHVIIGDDFRFGHDRQGDGQLLVTAGHDYGFTVSVVGAVHYKNERISSTRIRQLLQQNEMQQVAERLGRNYRMCGRVIYGDQRGRQWGIPTANVLLRRKVSPLTGVFVVQVYGLAKQPLKGVANIGHRPTVDGQRCLLEVHLFDFSADIYRQMIEVEFIHKLRDEQRFSSIDLLKQQILSDIEQAKTYFTGIRKAEDSMAKRIVK